MVLGGGAGKWCCELVLGADGGKAVESWGWELVLEGGFDMWCWGVMYRGDVGMWCWEEILGNGVERWF